MTGSRRGALTRPARVRAFPLRHELMRSGRRHSYLDGIVEFQEVRDRQPADPDPSLRVDMDAVAASLRYVRGE